MKFENNIKLRNFLREAIPECVKLVGAPDSVDKIERVDVNQNPSISDCAFISFSDDKTILAVSTELEVSELTDIGEAYKNDIKYTYHSLPKRGSLIAFFVQCYLRNCVADKTKQTDTSNQKAVVTVEINNKQEIAKIKRILVDGKLLLVTDAFLEMQATLTGVDTLKLYLPADSFEVKEAKDGD